MNLFGVMDISASGLRAERVRAEVSATNMANAETTRGVDGTPYQRQHVVFASAEPDTSFHSNMLHQISFNMRTGQSDSTAADAGVPGGVQVAGVVSDTSAPLQRFDPTNPDADKDGYVAYPDINPVTEMVDLMGASRAYGANASAVQAEKSMLSASLEILK